MTDDGPPLFDGEPGKCSLCGEPGHTHDDHWLFQHEPVKALQTRVLELEGFFCALGCQAGGLLMTSSEDRLVDAWRKEAEANQQVPLPSAHGGETMKCYRCGEESPEPEPTRAELTAELENVRGMVVAVQAEYDNERRRADYYQGAHASALAKLNGESPLGTTRYEDMVKALATAADLADGKKGETRYEDVDEAKATAAKLAEELNEAEGELIEQSCRIEELRGELRRYEPSDAMMYKLLEMQGRIDEAAALFKDILVAAGEHNAPWDDVDKWLDRHRTAIVPVGQPLEPHATILALHTTIDEGRRIMDRVWTIIGHAPVNETEADEYAATIAALDAWRNKVLTEQGREYAKTVADYCAKTVVDAVEYQLMAEVQELREVAELRAGLLKNAEAQLAKQAETIRDWRLSKGFEVE